MAVSKRTRYEVLRRDNHTCRYCGGTAPDVTLTVDHVTPVSLGGSDDPANLVAACRDCNAGKASSNPDASLVADVSADAIRWAAAIRVAAEQAAKDIQSRDAYRRRIVQVWEAWDEKWQWLDPGHIGTFARWQELGVPVDLVLEAVEIAWGNRRIKNRDVFRYMAGIVWSRLREIQDAAKATLQEKSPDTDPLGSVTEYDKGYEAGWTAGMAWSQQQEDSARIIDDFIDRRRGTWRVEQLITVPARGA